jgi:hypothetical protein
MSMARIVFSADGDYFYGVYTTNTNEKVYVTRDKSRGMQINSNSSMLKEITDPWIKKILDNTNISNECRGSMQVKPFFNKKVLHRSFFNINEAAARESNFSFGQVSCAGTSCIHYELRKNDKNKNIIRRTDFDIDKRMDPLFVALNKKYELFKNTTGDAVTLYPIALAIAYILQSNWTITPQELERKMGVLYRYIDFDLRKLIVVQLKPSFANATRYWLYTKSNSFLASVRTMSLVDSIKYGLGTVWWGVKMGGYVFLLYNMVKFARSSISKLRSQPGI